MDRDIDLFVQAFWDIAVLGPNQVKAELGDWMARLAASAP